MSPILVVLLLLAMAAAIGGYIMKRCFYRIPSGYIGLVYRKFVRMHPDDTFRQVKIHGSPGPQAALLIADRYRLLPRFLYTITPVEPVEIPPGTIGVVVAKDGAEAPLDQGLSKHVECSSFQDGQAFLLGGGQRGRQPKVLSGGKYIINPELFDVITVETIGEGRHGLTEDDLREISIPVGTTGVVVTLAGEPHDDDDDDDDGIAPRVPEHRSFQHPWVFLANGGRHGVQDETLSGGRNYQINPWFARIILIPTRDLILEWSRKQKDDNRFDATLDQIAVDVEGYRLRFDMQQTIRITAKAAPRLVHRFGEQEDDPVGPDGELKPAPVRRFVERVIGATVAGYFHSTAVEYEILKFLESHNEVRLEVEQRVRQALEELDIKVIRTTLGDFDPEESSLDELRRKIADERESKQFHEHELAKEKVKAGTEHIRIETERKRRAVEVTELEERVRILGRDAVAMEAFLAQLAKMNVPHYVSGDADALLQYLPLPVAREMINTALQRIPGADATQPQQLQTTADTGQVNQLPPEAHTSLLDLTDDGNMATVEKEESDGSD